MTELQECDLLCMHKQIKLEANKILSELDPSDFPEDAINWGDLKVIDVISCRSLAEGIYYEILIEEAEPGATNLHKVVIDRMPKHAFPILVRTEW